MSIVGSFVTKTCKPTHTHKLKIEVVMGLPQMEKYAAIWYDILIEWGSGRENGPHRPPPTGI